MKKRKMFMAVAAAALAVCMTGAAAQAEEMCASYLTGEQVPVSVGRQRPVGLMIENDSDAVQWQRGTSSASIMYEAMVEGAITRMEGFFEDYKDVSQIMPIRSCRPYYVYFANEFNAFYGHFGQVIYAVPVLQCPKTYDIAGLPFGEDGQNYQLHDGSAAYIRDHDGVTGIYTNYDLLHQVIENSGWSTEYDSQYKGHYQFAADGETVTLENGQVANVVLPGFIYNHPRFDYNPDDKLYYRSEFGSPQIDNLNGDSSWLIQTSLSRYARPPCSMTSICGLILLSRAESEPAGSSPTDAQSRSPGRRATGATTVLITPLLNPQMLRLTSASAISMSLITMTWTAMRSPSIRARHSSRSFVNRMRPKSLLQMILM